MDLEQQAIAELRALKLAPKQIARKLGLKPAEVQAVIKQEAEQAALSRAATGELDPVVECLVNADCVRTLLSPKLTVRSSSLVTSNAADDVEESFTGLALVAVARQRAYNRLAVCTYLVDPWCLGIKDAMGPRQLSLVEYEQLIENAYGSFSNPATKISLEQAQAIVFSAFEYAASLGFSPHRDFEQARTHLGQWRDETRIQCGRNGKPFYISGPYDNPQKIINTLKTSVGEGNFDYLLGMSRE